MKKILLLTALVLIFASAALADTPTPTPTFIIAGNNYYQSTDTSGSFQAGPGSNSGRIWVYTVIDTISNTAEPIYIYNGAQLLRKIIVTSFPFIIDMGRARVQIPIIDYGLNTGTSFTNIQ